MSSEKGDYLALDLGGTNFRVLHVRVVEEEQTVLKMDSQICAIPQEMMLGPGEEVTQHKSATNMKEPIYIKINCGFIYYCFV